MGKKRVPGLFKRGQTWHIDKHIHGQRLRESTFTSSLEEAEKYLVKRIEDIRLSIVYGVRPKRTFKQAAMKYLLENNAKKTLDVDARNIEILDKYIGDMPLQSIHMGILETYISDRKKDVKNRTVNHGLQILRRILNLAATEWLDETGLTWLPTAPKIKLLSEKDKRAPYPISWQEQEKLLCELPEHLKDIVLFTANTGCRNNEICELRWSWEYYIEVLETSVFVIPGGYTKNSDPKLVVLNEIAKEVVHKQRGLHEEFVFTYKGSAYSNVMTSAYKRARIRAGLKQVRIHDLRHTFGRRLRCAGVAMEDIADLMGHKTARITTHYSAAEIGNLHKAVNKICNEDLSTPTLLFLRDEASSPHKIPTVGKNKSGLGTVSL